VRVSCFHKGAVLARLLLVAGIATAGSALAQSDNLAALNQRINQMYNAGKYGEAIPLAEKSLELTRSLKGQDHLDVGTSLNNLAELYRNQGRYGEAEPLCQSALALYAKVLGTDHPFVAVPLNNLAALYQTQGRYGEAEPLYKRALAGEYCHNPSRLPRRREPRQAGPA
jgi:tetratricopeptide (TPR) repeat protein